VSTPKCGPANEQATWENPQDDEANIAWVRNCVSDMRRVSDGGTCLNFPWFLEEGQELMRDTYGPERP
jgi:hypothetical protein